MEYSSTKDIIAKGKFLSDNDSEFIDSHIGDIQDNWGKRQVFRTETEMRISVLNDLKFPTQASKYWQCVREQGVFYENLVTLSFDYRRNKIEQQIIERDMKDVSLDEFDRDLLQIDLEEKQFRQLNMEQVAKDRMREIRLWSQLMQETVDADPTFDTENVNTHQLLSYGLRFENQMQNIGNASPSEMSNLVGQYESTVKALKEEGTPLKLNTALPISTVPGQTPGSLVPPSPEPVPEIVQSINYNLA